jgi:hypothetical protein
MMVLEANFGIFLLYSLFYRTWVGLSETGVDIVMWSLPGRKFDLKVWNLP